MEYKIVCISTADGAMGDDIGTRVASELGFRLVNEQIVASAAEQAGVQAHVMADVEQRRSVVDRVIHELLGKATPGVSLGIAPVVTEPAPSVESLRALIRSVIEQIASTGDAVIVSHAASHALATRADTLRILITARPETRVARVRAARKLSEKEAEKQIARGDANRADYIKRFYDVSPELPIHYDIVLNSDRFSVEQAVDVIVHAATSGHLVD